MAEASKVKRQAPHRDKGAVAISRQHGVLQREKLHLNDLVDDTLDLVQINRSGHPLRLPSNETLPAAAAQWRSQHAL